MKKSSVATLIITVVIIPLTLFLGTRLPGRWYYLDTMYGMDHFDFCGTKHYPTSFEDFYFGMVDMANSR